MARTALVKSPGGLMAWLGLALILLIADQFTKVLIVGYYRLGDSTPVTSFFNIVRAHNSGAAFSFLAGASGWQRWFFTALGVAAALFIVWMLRSHTGQKLFSFALACILVMMMIVLKTFGELARGAGVIHAGSRRRRRNGVHFTQSGCPRGGQAMKQIRLKDRKSSCVTLRSAENTNSPVPKSATLTK